MTFRRLPLDQSRITWLYYDPNTLGLTFSNYFNLLNALRSTSKA